MLVLINFLFYFILFINIGWVCANCKTSNTPGWRAGETPDQKLCNGKFIAFFN